ncbi:MAG: formylglycine-generating enzyme family protein [Acidobacteriota bacterium]
MTIRRRTLVVVLGTVVLVGAGTSLLVAPGPPSFIVEPSTGMILVAIEPGTFVMGSPVGERGRGDDEQQHRVMLTRRVFMGRDEVTQAQWRMVMGQNPSQFTGCERCPVESVNFYDVNDFLSRLGAGSSAMRFRLPTEAEWEYACRAGTITPFNVGPDLAPDQANYNARFPYDGQEPSMPPDRTTPVGSFPPNAWGLRDMHGNVWEWINDWYGPYDPAQAVDPTGARGGTTRVIRGGSWHFDANSARCALRYTHTPVDRGHSLGFRVVADVIARD